MQTIGSSLAADARTLPANGAARHRQLYRLIDLHASAEAAAALHSAAERAAGETVAGALSAASAALGNAADDAARDGLRNAVASPAFLALVPGWISELRSIASTKPGTGACTAASALELWSWTMTHFQGNDQGRSEPAAAAIDELAAALAPLLAARCLVLEIASITAPATPAEVEWRLDLSHVHAAHAAALMGAACAELVFGYRKHMVWDSEGCATCFSGDEADGLDALIPGIASGARMSASVVEADGTHAAKAGPCARFDGVESFTRLRNRLDGCLTGARIAKDRAVSALARSMAATNSEGNA